MMHEYQNLAMQLNPYPLNPPSAGRGNGAMRDYAPPTPEQQKAAEDQQAAFVRLQEKQALLQLRLYAASLAAQVWPAGPEEAFNTIVVEVMNCLLVDADPKFHS